MRAWATGLLFGRGRVSVASHRAAAISLALTGQSSSF